VFLLGKVGLLWREDWTLGLLSEGEVCLHEMVGLMLVLLLGRELNFVDEQMVAEGRVY